jgi:rubrerythrin
MKRKWDDEDVDHDEDLEDSTDEEADDDEEPRIKMVLEDLPESVSQKDASELLHSMASSRNILFWTPGDELLRNQRRIPRTNIVELIEYALLPFNKDIPEPRGLKSFVEGLAKLGINKKGIKNEKVLNEVLRIEKETGENEQNEDESEDEDSEESEESQDHEESEQDGEGESSEEEDEDDEEENEEEEEEEKENKNHSCSHCGHSDLDIKSIVGCPKCQWHDGLFQSRLRVNQRTTCPICQHNFPLNHDTVKSVLVACNDCNNVSQHHRS